MASAEGMNITTFLQGIPPVESWDFLPNPQGAEEGAAAGAASSGWSALVPGASWSDASPSQSRKTGSSSEGRRHRREASAPYSSRPARPQGQDALSASACDGGEHGEAQVAATREKAAREKARVLLLPSGTYQRHRLRMLAQVFKLLDEKAPPRDEVSELMKSLAL
ncbi:hypothetical protein T484DRAFT_1877131 [Baffinella frigidus]|nr:hypothetical protein T484DRAFT_1877131 [Cryptophyta sp. CCMP2293]